jgi:hypothetical protein
MTDQNGRRTEVSAIHLDNADKVLSELKARQEGKSVDSFEADVLELVQTQTPRGNEAGICVQNRENGAKSAANPGDDKPIPANSPAAHGSAGMQEIANRPISEH